MKPLQDAQHAESMRHALMQFLNGYNLEAPAILSMARQSEPVVFDAGEVILQQGEDNTHVYFLLEGRIEILLDTGRGRLQSLGEREAVTVLGEISYFNRSPATATVRATEKAGVAMLRLSYEVFSQVIGTYPSVEHALARIGEMRVIRQYNGFCSLRFFKDMTGWKRDRLAVNRALFSHLEDAVLLGLLPRLPRGKRLLDVGDGPAVVSEIIYEQEPERLDDLHLQATHLEDAILNPLKPYPSDLSRAGHLRERFDAIAALQVFNHVPAESLGQHLALAERLLRTDGLLLVVQLRVLDIHYAEEQTESQLVFQELETLVRRYWPDVLGEQSLVSVTFLDADFDPMMEWNARFCERAAAGALAVPPEVSGQERPLLEQLLHQAAQSLFDPDGLYFHWLAWHCTRHAFVLEESQQKPDVGFFYQLYRRTPAERQVHIYHD